MNNVVGDLYQIGVVVRNLDTGMENYRRLLGLGPFKRLDTDYVARFRHWTGRIRNRNAFARWGQVYLEMIEPGEGQSAAREWLDTRGEGIFHLGYAVDELERRPLDAAVCFEALDANDPRREPQLVMLDTVDSLGYFTELATRDLVRRLCAWIDGQGELGG